MGFFIKKSFNFGPVRFNLSKSGIGVSTGVKGLRVGVDSKGRSYVDGGKGMLRYKKYLGKKKSTGGCRARVSDKQCAPCGINFFDILIKIIILAAVLYAVYSCVIQP